jgi:superoxide dismutase, Cu-Zn family
MTEMRAVAAVGAVALMALTAGACGNGDGGAPGTLDQTPETQQQQAATPGAPAGGVTVELQGRDGQSMGGARLEPEGDGVRVSIRVTGLTPNQEHGLHFHAVGRCEGPTFESAGGHFAPHGRQHGSENPQGPHAGDLPNLRANAEGVADTSFVTNTVRLASGVEQGLFQQGGTALVVHAQPDDYRTDPSGNSGDRIACGVIRGG